MEARMDPTQRASRTREQLDLFRGAETEDSEAIWVALPEDARRDVLRLIGQLLRAASEVADDER
jgi:hypothetical protein